MDEFTALLNRANHDENTMEIVSCLGGLHQILNEYIRITRNYEKEPLLNPQQMEQIAQIISTAPRRLDENEQEDDENEEHMNLQLNISKQNAPNDSAPSLDKEMVPDLRPGQRDREARHHCCPQEITDLCTLYTYRIVWKFKEGDRLQVKDRQTGVVRQYLHILKCGLTLNLTHFSVIPESYTIRCDTLGNLIFLKRVNRIELDRWSANARDGSIHGQQIFETSEGRGFFAPLRSVVNVTAKSEITEGGFARLKGLIRVTHFNGETVEILCYVERKGRWKVKLLHAKSEKKYLGVKEEHLDPIRVWEPLIDHNRPRKESLKE